MAFWGRVNKSPRFLTATSREWYNNAQCDSTIREHFPEGSRPVLFPPQLKAELWFVSSDLAFDFSHPLLPNTVCIGGQMAIPMEPITLSK